MIYEVYISCVAEREVVHCETRSSDFAGIFATLEQPAAETMLPECILLTHWILTYLLVTLMLFFIFLDNSRYCKCTSISFWV